MVSREGPVRYGSVSRIRLYDWEEIGWLTSETGRQALAIALTGMMQDGEITRGRAVEIARMVLRENALKLYGWQAGSKR